jgi:hypothetical protein
MKCHTESTLPPAMTMQNHVCHASAKGSPTDTQHSRFLLEPINLHFFVLSISIGKNTNLFQVRIEN